ncbi:MAG TPA: heme peroxidase family protein [Kouleothrix sp.]|jgi:hypothetical protein|nr:heme peroxidase family protein [Kouleothrix sp.]
MSIAERKPTTNGLPDPTADPDTTTNGEPTTPTTTPTDTPARPGSHYASAARRAHGTGVRGETLSRQSSQFEGRFGRMFRTLPAAFHTEGELTALGQQMSAEAEAQPTPETERDDEENLGISAGYTYLGQFIDHDLTFDPNSSLQRQNDPDGLTNFRTPRFDLDCLYGRGPDDQPYLYADDGVHLLLGRTLTGNSADPNTRDVPRNTPNPGEPARALIGDPRNDENVIVSQIQATMMRFHNRMADLMQPLPFERIQREVRFHYQWVVLHDFLPTIIGDDMVRDLLPQLAQDGVRNGVKEFKPNLHFFKPKYESYIPVEFSVAAYRFGHSMVRPIYRLNTALRNRQEIFATDPFQSLVGFREFPSTWAIDWGLFFRMDENAPLLGRERVQMAYKIDSSLVNPLAHLPSSVVKNTPNLAERNLLRGLRMSLPSGQAVARAMGLPVIPDDRLRVGKATEKAHATNIRLADIAPNFADNAPLWYYILAEAQQAFFDDETPIRLGPVGGRLVGEVFVGLLHGDSHSYLRQNPGWRPRDEFVHNGKFGMAELIRAAQD